MLHTKVIFHDDATRNQTATTDDVDIITLKVTMKATMKMMSLVDFLSIALLELHDPSRRCNIYVL